MHDCPNELSILRPFSEDDWEHSKKVRMDARKHYIDSGQLPGYAYITEEEYAEERKQQEGSIYATWRDFYCSRCGKMIVSILQGHTIHVGSENWARYMNSNLPCIDFNTVNP